jgi:FkbM family methyltransferase
LSSALLRRLHLSHFWTIQTSGVRMKFFPAQWPIRLWENPDFFHRDTAFFRRWLRSGDVLVDCGANVGLLTLVGASAVGPAGTVHSAEAHPRIFRFLAENVALNGFENVRLVHAAVGEKEGSITFSDGLDDGNHVVLSGGELQVPMRRLDAVVPDVSVRLLKIDVEGYEKFVLQGGMRTLRSSECVYFESADKWFERYGYTCREVFDLLEKEGFVLFRYTGEASISRLPPGYHSATVENLIAVRDPEELMRRTGYEMRLS